MQDLIINNISQKNSDLSNSFVVSWSNQIHTAHT